MYLNLQGSTRYVIKNLYPVYLPPLPPRDQILNNSLKRSDQMWRRTPLPPFWDERRAEEIYNQDLEQKLVEEGAIPKVKYFDKVLENYRRQEWQRRTFGIYIYINGMPTYLTGPHYWFLQWCKMDHPDNDGYPIFYMPQLDRWYFRQRCMEDPWCLGYLIVGPRGFGKTAEEVAAVLENITRPGHNRHAAIQSKNAEDAERVIFQEKMVPMFNALPDFFKPAYSHGTDPKDGMWFRRQAIRSKKAKFVKHGEEYELGNSILCYPPQTLTLDGKTLADLLNDEIGKIIPVKDTDAYARNVVNVRTVYRNNQKRGLIRATTTVEEMDKGGDECFSIWEESNPARRDGNGYTISKLYKFFVSAVETQTQFADKFGNIPQDIAYRHIMNERAPVQDDNYKLSLLMRKNPTTEEEAFLKDQSKCIYDVMIISKRISELKMLNRPMRRYTAEWVNGKVDGDVELVEYNEGPITLYYDPDVYWSSKRKLLNACTSEISERNDKQLWLPCNNDLFRASTDPIRFVKTTDKRASMMAGHGMMLYIPDLDNGKEDSRQWISHNIMWEYHARHTDPEEDFENMIKLMRYFGHSIMPEANAGEFIKHLYSRGYQKFLIVRRHFDFEVLSNKLSKNKLSGDNAVSSNTEVIESYVRRTAAWIRRHGHRINSLPLLEQLLSFDAKDPTAFDLAVSFGYGVLAMEADLQDYDFNSQKESEMVLQAFKRYDISGNQSKLIPSYTAEDLDENGELSDFEDPNFWKHLMHG